MPDINEALAAVVAEDEQPLTITIYQPDGEPYKAADGSDATMSVLGSEAKAVRAAQDRALRRFVRSRGRSKDEIEEARQNRIETAAAAVVAWHGWYGPDKQDVPPTPENVEKVFRVQHILQQVEEAVVGHARFFRQQSTT